MFPCISTHVSIEYFPLDLTDRFRNIKFLLHFSVRYDILNVCMCVCLCFIFIFFKSLGHYGICNRLFSVKEFKIV